MDASFNAVGSLNLIFSINAVGSFNLIFYINAFILELTPSCISAFFIGFQLPSGTSDF